MAKMVVNSMTNNLPKDGEGNILLNGSRRDPLVVYTHNTNGAWSLAPSSFKKNRRPNMASVIPTNVFMMNTTMFWKFIVLIVGEKEVGVKRYSLTLVVGNQLNTCFLAATPLWGPWRLLRKRYFRISLRLKALSLFYVIQRADDLYVRRSAKIEPVLELASRYRHAPSGNRRCLA